MRTLPIIARRLAAAVALAAASHASLPVSQALAGEEIVVFAAASLKNALDEITATWARETGHTARLSLAGSSALAKQIQQGAPADLFISASIQWMDTLAADKLVDGATRIDLLRNRLVLIAHGKGAPPVAIANGLDLAGLLKDGKLAMAMVDSVPAGMYGKAALTSLGIWDKVAAHVAQADNVRAALTLVARDEAPYGIVYATDAAAEDKVTVVGAFPADSHPPIVYPAAVTAESRKKETARGLLTYLQSAGARQAFARQGFTVDEPAPAN